LHESGRIGEAAGRVQHHLDLPGAPGPTGETAAHRTSVRLSSRACVVNERTSGSAALSHGAGDGEPRAFAQTSATHSAIPEAANALTRESYIRRSDPPRANEAA
jgi:hypothetical protein